MMLLNTLLYLFFLTSSALSHETSHVVNINVQATAHGYRLAKIDVNVSKIIIDLIYTIGQKQCIRQCLRNRQCHSVNYCKPKLLCATLRAKNWDTGVSLVQAPKCVYSEMDNQPQELAGACTPNPCDDACVVLSNGKTYCDDICPKNFLWNGTQRLCFSLYNVTLNWWDAVDFCKSVDNRTRLAVLDTAGKVEALKAKGNRPYYWLGASYNLTGTPSEGKAAFYWNTGEKVSTELLEHYSVGNGSAGKCLEVYTFSKTVGIASYSSTGPLTNSPVCEYIL